MTPFGKNLYDSSNSGFKFVINEDPAEEEEEPTKPTNTNNGVTTIVDNTTADKDLPKTGKELIAIAVVVIVICGLVGYIRYKKLDIK